MRYYVYFFKYRNFSNNNTTLAKVLSLKTFPLLLYPFDCSHFWCFKQMIQIFYIFWCHSLAHNKNFIFGFSGSYVMVILSKGPGLRRTHQRKWNSKGFIKESLGSFFWDLSIVKRETLLIQEMIFRIQVYNFNVYSFIFLGYKQSKTKTNQISLESDSFQAVFSWVFDQNSVGQKQPFLSVCLSTFWRDIYICPFDRWLDSNDADVSFHLLVLQRSFGGFPIFSRS